MTESNGWIHGDHQANVRRTLAAVEHLEDRVSAWAHLDRSGLLAQADRLGQDNQPSAEQGLLRGLPLGVKDTIDVASMPAERGSAAFAGRRPEHDAEVVRRARAAGALIAGKTVTTELAVTFPGPTTNPHDSARTPGGSSSGSAAAIAAGMVPLALGTQTIASTLRPASFCGVVGFKPTHGRVPIDGALSMSPEVDTIGLLGADATLVSALFSAVADSVRDVSPMPRHPVVGVLRTPWWHHAEPSSRAAVDDTCDALAETGAQLRQVDLDAELVAVIPAHWDVVRSGIARQMGAVARAQPELLSPELRQVVDLGAAIDRRVLEGARRTLRDLATTVADRLGECDVVVTPCVVGEAPRGLTWTGDPIFCQPWSAFGFPAISLPLAVGSAGLPIGVQFVAAPDRDEHLLAFARAWMERDPRMARR
ncbi:amidase [Streptosporangium sp. NBC_01755]|uniref:amidase n=1 Tax=unclassified Streptosporangium TaxID=2632669 RepID=UPI002DD8BA73|nr:MULTISPECIES: amidase [unclassified Streptosporangium]WSA28243.1 amidase [Streptosporangium sp. NBC_01810]WSD00280.1 amidase [Streptosporangium sp. NBC_01755]